MSVIRKKSIYIGKNVLTTCGLFVHQPWRTYSVTSESVTKDCESTIKKAVFISQSKDIFTNLALEDWFYRNYDLKNQHLLLLWRNNPCIVIGRHQNPWVETNTQVLQENGIALARRNSGGGTVYHDTGNLNLSFFTPSQRYNRNYNLNIITRALYREWGIKSVLNKKEDIVVQGEFKVSGTAAKLGRPNAYHHCTLLVDVNKSALHVALEKKESGITTNATESIRSPVKNLVEINSHIRIDDLLTAIGWEYLRTKALTMEDGGYKLVQKQKGFQMINPTEDWFPGINELIEEFRSWNWIYGKTPKFTLTRTLEMTRMEQHSERFLTLSLQVQNGIVKDIKMSLPKNIAPDSLNRDVSVITNLRGARYSHEITDKIIAATGCKLVPIDTCCNVDKSGLAATQ